MSTFLTDAACNGHPPRSLAALRHYQRPGLTARLLRERQVARFIVAPAGFGKTALALEYAETVFGYRHVFWIDGRSPCFLRDLDRDIIGKTLLAIDPDRFLAVFEDVPLLDVDRAGLLSRSFDALLDRGCEVMATCTPLCDAFERLQHDRLKMVARDLLLNDAEIDAVRTADEKLSQPAEGLPSSQRVAGLRWASPGGTRPFIAAALQEELPVDVLFAIVVMLVLREGGVADIGAFGPGNGGTMSFLAESYLYLGIDARSDRFESFRFSVEDIAGVLDGRMDCLAACSHFPECDTLVERLADALIARSSARRACGFMGALGSLPTRAAWLANHGDDLLDASCFLPACELYDSLRGRPCVVTPALSAAQSIRLLVLGDGGGACQLARRVLADGDVSEGARVVSALVLLRGESGKARAAAFERLKTLVTGLEDDGGLIRAAGHGTFGDGVWGKPLVYVTVAYARSTVLAARVWRACRENGADHRALLVGASWILDDLVPAVVDGEPVSRNDARSADDADIVRVASFVRSRCNALSSSSCEFSTALAGVALERACESGAVDVPPPHARASLAVHRVEMGVFAQRNAYERVMRERDERRREYVLTHPDVFRVGTPAQVIGSAFEPRLTVNLFGGLEVRIGDNPVDPRCFRRQKVKTLLALLVLNRGREFSRDTLVQLLWPDSSLESARKNFYSIWSLLRRALVTPTGACPYLIRQQNGLRLDGRLLTTDVVQLESICRTLQLEHPGYGGWSSILSQVNDRFSDDLLPSECDNEYIVQRRVDYRNRFVDALVAASRRLVQAGGVQEGLWFARAALARDRTREDAYTTLMGAQLAVGQRTAALETYFACRRFLSDELGIDPSLETMNLYHRIIETEEALR